MKIKIGGFIELSLIDVLFYPSAVIFFSGCNFRCPWCQNGPLVLGEGDEIEVDELVEKITKNFLIEYVQASGGEPTLQKEGLIEFFQKIKDKNLKTSLDTNASNPDVIKELLDKELIDHVALDLKAPKEKYNLLTSVNVDFKRIEKSLEILQDFKFLEIRTTFVPNLLTEEDIFKIVEIAQSYLKDFYYVLQNFYPSETILNKEFLKLKPLPVEKLVEIGKKLKEKGIKVFIRTKEKGVIKL